MSDFTLEEHVELIVEELSKQNELLSQIVANTQCLADIEPAAISTIAELLPSLVDVIAHMPLTNLTNIIAAATATMQADRPAPGHRARLVDYPTYPWERIGAEVIASDEYGATIVSWQGHSYRRRTHPKYGTHIWFSRGAGRDEEGNAHYERLITFGADEDVEDLPRGVVELLPPASEPQPASQPQAPRPTAQEQDDDGPQFEDGSPGRPADPPAAPRQDPRAAVFAMLPKLISAGTITPDQANAYSKRARTEGFAVVLDELRGLA